MNQMPPTQTQSLAIQHHHHHQHQQLQQQQPQKQMQHHNSLPPSNSIGGSWYGGGGGGGVSSGHPHGGPPPQQTMGLGRNYPPNPDAYAMTTSAAAGARNMVQFYEGGGGGSTTTTTMQRGHVTSSSSSPEYNRQAMIQGHSVQNGYGLSNGMMLNGYGLNDPTMLDASSSATMATHPMMSPGVGSRPMQVISPSADYYQDQQRMPPLGRPPLYSQQQQQQQQQQFDPCLPGQGLMMESVRIQMGPGMGPETIQDAPSMVCREVRGSLAQQQRTTTTMMMGYGSSSSQRVMPYPNPQQYMQNKRAQYNNVQQRKTYDYDPTTMHQYNSASSSSVCYGPSGGGWPRQSLPLQQRTMASPDGYPPTAGGMAFHVKEEPDHPYLHMAVHGQNQWQSNREPALRNNAFSPPPGNPTPPMTPGSTCMPCHPGPDPSDHIRSTGMRIFRENELYFTFPVQDGMIKAPFQLEHNAPISCHIFNLNDQLHEWLMARPDLELMLKCFHKEDRLLSTNWPNSVSISLNEVPLMIDRGGGTATPTSPHHPIFLKSICKPGQNALQISVTTCCCSHLFVLQIVHRPSVRSVFQGLMTKRLLPASNTIAKIKRLLSQVTMMAPASLTSEQPQNMPLPLTCPLSMQRIVVPSRGRDCQHIQCFDLESYLKLNCHRNHWHCPLCKKMAALDGLEVDQFLWAVLDHPSSACSDAVLLDISANWKPLPRPGAEYGSEAAHVVYKKYVMATAMPLPSPGNYATMTAGKTPTANGTALLAAGSSATSHQKEMSVQPLERHQKRAPPPPTGSSETAPTNYLGCLSQMTNVFLGPDSSPSGGGGPQQTSNMEHMGSFPPTPMGSQISQICTPLDGQSLHPRTPSEGHATHPHTPPDGHPFTPLLDSQTQPSYGKTPAPEGHAATVAPNPLTPSTTGFDLCSSSSSSSRRATGGKTTTAPDGTSSSAAAGLTLGSGSNSEGSASERESGKHDRSAGQASGAEGSSGSMENALMTEDLTKLDFKSNLTLCDDNQDMLSLLPGSFDYDDLSDLTCYLGGGGGSSAPKTTTTPAKDNSTNKDALDDDDDDFMSFLN